MEMCETINHLLLTGGIDFSSEVQNFMIRFIIETIMPIYRKEQVNGFTM